YRLAEARKPAGLAATIRQPVVSEGIVRTYEPASRARKRYVSAKKRTNDEISTLNSFNRQIYAEIRKDRLKSAKSLLDKHVNLLDDVEYDLLRAEIASAYLHHGNADTAYQLARASVKRSGLHVPKAGWVAGLVAWRNGKYMDAARYFEVTARSPYASGWTLTAGAYWAARSHMRTGNVKMVSSWLKRGIKQPRTFYGLVSTRALGRDFDFNWKIPAFTKKYLNILSEIPEGQRAIALVMAGQVDLAEAELIRVKPENEEQRTALLAYANYANLPGLALRLATDASGASGDVYDAALYPMGNWRLTDGKVDPALVHAIMRQESRFDPNAESPSGAKGLMQLMPATAKSVAVTGEERLDHAETNLELGRRYIENLLDTDVVGGNLVYLLIAYNAGPGNLAKWKRRWPDVKDPLLFIELIPASETRAYVERVLSNYWIYRLREGADTPTLDAITSGKAPLYGFKNDAKEL
ncbi:MAG: lytic transglycosylase domain-containing protein, partial [Alphaproteobacteria bacterium]|nr:lytic transglycosylase domain-containing protein [Alphaproteobacteria bacterium]